MTGSRARSARRGMTLDDVIAVARDGRARRRSPTSRSPAMAATRAQVDALARSAEPVYGISTGFGALANRHIPVERRVQLQRSLIRSHAAGMGAPVEREVVRALMLLRLKTLASGRTGVRPVVAQTMAALLNAGITPVVHEYGSLGCSGDLAPLVALRPGAHGRGRVPSDRDGVERPVPELLAEAGIEPVELREKEGLALINGTDGMLGMLHHGDRRPRAPVRRRRPHRRDERRGAARHRRRCSAPTCTPSCARTRARPSAPRTCCATSPAPASSRRTRSDDDRVQDAYSLRCAPQVTGAVRDTITHAPTVAERELPAAIDNPVVLADGTDLEQRQLPRRPGRLRPRLPGHRRRRPRLDGRAPHRSDARQEPHPRPAARSSRTIRASTAA